MSWIWIVPAAVAVAGLVLVAVLVREVGSAARALGSEIERTSDLRPALVTLRHDAVASRRSLHRLRTR